MPKLYYSALKAYRKEKDRLLLQGSDDRRLLDELKASIDIERQQNKAEFARLQGEDLLYGQIVQLLCSSSDEYITVRKAMAKIESQCLKVDMDEFGDEGSWFRVEPAFKFRSLGNRVAHGDSIRLISVKFEQFLHVSMKSLPFTKGYIDGVNEVNASQTATQFQVIPFSTLQESDTRDILCGQVTGIYHSEVNAFLMFDPVNSSKGPYWSVTSASKHNKKQASNSLWVLESENVEWGGSPVEATCGVKSTDRSKKRGYRLEHANSGLYLSLSTAAADNMTKLTMTESFMSDKTLWYFHYKHEGSEEDEGKSSLMSFDSVAPIYMQHSSGIWLSQVCADDSNQSSSDSSGDGHERVVACRKDLSFTDSLSIVDVDQGAMTDISRLQKHLKPLEFYLSDLRRREAVLNISCVETEELRHFVSKSKKSSSGKGGQSDSAQNSLTPKDKQRGDTLQESFQNGMAHLNPVNIASSVGISQLNPFHSSETEDHPLTIAQELTLQIEAMRKQAVNDRSRITHKRLAGLFWLIAKARSPSLVARKQTEIQHLLTKRVEVCNSLKEIEKWLVNYDGEQEQQCWLQNTLREQGALAHLNKILLSLVDAGLSIKDYQPKGKVKGMRDIVVSGCVFEVGQGIYDILGLACNGNSLNSLALERSIGLYDLHLGTRYHAASLLREIFKNRKIMNSLKEEDVKRYAILMSQHRKPAFVELIRSLLTCDDKPVSINQRRISRYLLSDFRASLPEVNVVKGGSAAETKIFVKVKKEGSDTLPTPTRSASRMMASSAWCDLAHFIESFSQVAAKDASQMDDKELTVAYYGETLWLFRDLCFGRCPEAITMLGGISQLGLEYESVLSAMQSSLIPLEIRARMCEIMIHLHLDRDPQQVKTVVKLVHAWHKQDPRFGNAERNLTSVKSNAFADLKEATLLHLERCLTTSAEPEALEAHIVLLKFYCEIAVKLCYFGFFTPASDTESCTVDMQRLVHATLDNLSGGSLLQQGMAESSPSTADVLFLLCRILEFVLDTRLDLRTSRVIMAYKGCYEKKGNTDDIFWDKQVIDNLHDQVRCSIISNRLGGSFDGEFVDCLLALTKVQGNVKLQAMAFKLLMRQATPMDELVSIAGQVELLENQDAVLCYETLCKSTNAIRARLDDVVSKERSDVLKEISDHLHTLIELTNPTRYGEHLVQESQKFMRLNQCHTFIYEILRIPLEVTHTPQKLDKAVNPTMHSLFADCYEFLQGFCYKNPENQAELFGQMGLFFEHLSIEGLNVAECIIATIRDNAELGAKVTEKILRRFMTAIVKFGKYARWLRFMLVSLTVEGVPMKRSQDLVLRLLEEEADILMETDGNQGGGEGDAANVLMREGNATRFELMMQREHTKADSFLEYHVMCLEVLAKCAEGDKNQANKEKCQALLSFDQVLESILDLHLIDRPEGNTRKLPPDSLHYIRSAFVRFLRQVYVTRTDVKTQKRFAEEGNRWYACPSLLVDKWRNQAGLMDHFIDEIDTLRKAHLSSKNLHLQHRDLSSAIHSTLQGEGIEVLPIEYHWSYVFGSIIPCLYDYYTHQYGFTLNTNSRYSEYCKQYAGQLSHAITSLLDIVEVDPTEADICKRLLMQLEALGIPSKSDKIMLALEQSCRKPVQTVQIKLKSYWTKFVQQLVEKLGFASMDSGIGVGTREMSRLLSERGEEYLPHLMHVLAVAMHNSDIVDDKFVQDMLQALRGAIYVAVSVKETQDSNWALFLKERPPVAAPTPLSQSILKCGVLQTAMLLLSHANEDVVLIAVRLAWLILFTFKKDAQNFAVEVLDKESVSILESCRLGMKKFLEKMKAGKKQRRKASGGESENEPIKMASSANRACELLQMIELLCKGNRKVQSSLNKHLVLSTLVEVMEEIERNILSAVTSKDIVTSFTLAKAFHVLVAAIEGPNNQNRLGLTQTNILLMMNRVFGTLNYNSSDAVHNILKASIRSACAQLLLELLQSPADPVVAKRVLETIDWDQFFRCWKELSDLVHAQMSFWSTDPSDFLLTLPFRRYESLYDFFDRVDLECPAASAGFVLSTRAEPQEASLDRSHLDASFASEVDPGAFAGMIRLAVVDVVYEGFAMANVVRIALEGSLFSSSMSALLRRQEELSKLASSRDDLTFFSSRICSVEINREDSLERLYFLLPEACVRLQKETAFLRRVENALFQDLDTENDEERQKALLERMTSLSDELQSEFELSSGPHRWIIDYQAW